MALVPCFEPVCASCPIVPACGLRGALYEARQAFLSALDRYTVADVVARREELRGLLALPAPVPRPDRAAPTGPPESDRPDRAVRIGPAGPSDPRGTARG